jgi:hypothetical protein
MQRPSTAIVLAIVLALSWISFFASAPRAQERRPPARPQWAYMFADSHGDVTELGKDGWEAYAVSQTERSTRIYLKRAR